MSNDQLDILDLTTDFLMKSISQEDEKKLMAWIESSPDNRRRFQTYCELWAASHHEHYDSQAAFRRFLKNKGALARKRDELRAKRRNHIYTVLLRAAVIVMPLLLATTILLYAYQERLLEKTITYTTVEGQQSSFILPDGTTVSMEENSCLSFSQRDFIHGTRKVTFEGEAYFDVTSDKLHPLDILTKQERVHVTGTGFKLLSRSGSEYNVLSLDHGSVEYTHLPTGERTAMVGGDVLTLNKQAGKCHLRRRGPFEINLEADRELQDADIQRYETANGDKAIFVSVNHTIQPGVYELKMNDSKNAVNLCRSSRETPFQSGQGTKESPYIIASAGQLCHMRTALIPRRMVYFALAADIDLGGIDWEPVGDMPDTGWTTYWINFDGRGHIIRNLSMHTESTSASFFGVLCGVCRNVGFENALVCSSGACTGILAGCIGDENYPDTTLVEDCFFTGHAESGGKVGGITGKTRGKVALRRCYSSVDVTAGQGVAAGMVAKVCGDLTVEHSYINGNVTGDVASGVFAMRRDESARVTLSNVIVSSKAINGATKAYAIGEFASSDKAKDVNHANTTHLNNRPTEDGIRSSQIRSALLRWPRTWFRQDKYLQ